MSKEQWRPVPGFKGFYEVSDQGRVRSVDRIVVTRNGVKQRSLGRVLATSMNRWGRPRVRLYEGGREHNFEVRDLVSMAFPDVNGVTIWNRGPQPLVVTYEEAMRLLATSEQAVSWYRAQLAAMSLAHEQLKAKLGETAPKLTVAA